MVRVLEVLPDGSTEILATLGAGQVFGEMGILEDRPRAVRAVAVAPSELYVLDRASFNTLRVNFQPSAYKFIRALSMVIIQRLRETNRKVVILYEEPERSIEYLKQKVSRRRQEGRAWVPHC